MEKQYLLLAEQIIFRNNKLSLINVMDQFLAIHLPASFNFDLAFICGPGWQPGNYDLMFKVQIDDKDPVELGAIKATIDSEKSIFNAIAADLNFGLDRNTHEVTFIIERNGQAVYTRTYPVAYLFELKQNEDQLTGQ